MKPFRKLLLNWKEPHLGNNFLVGILIKGVSSYKFYYNQAILREAEKNGFVPFVGFSDTNAIYESEKIFSIFERRLPGTNRFTFKKFIENNNLTMSDDVSWDYLSISKGKLATDTLSFVSPILFENNRLYLSCEVAGWRHTKDFNQELNLRDTLIVGIDKQNEMDPFAVEIIDQTNNNQRVGYIPKPFNDLFYRLLSKGITINARVYQFNQDDNRPNVLIFSMEIAKEIVEKEMDLSYLVEYSD